MSNDSHRLQDTSVYFSYPEQFDDFCTDLWSEFLSEAFPPAKGVGRRPRVSREEQMRVIWMNLYWQWHVDPERLISIPMRDVTYTTDDHYRQLGLTKLLPKMIRHLIDTGVLTLVKKGSEISGKMTRVKPSKKLRNRFKRFAPEIKPVQLKDENKKPINYEETADTLRWGDILRRYNALLERTHIDVGHFTNKDHRKYGLNLSRRKHVYRQFNNSSFSQYGRIHGAWWQLLPSQWRKDILIDDFETVEVDFTAMSTYITYGIEGVKPPMKDPYKLKAPREFIDGPTQRKFLKKLISIAYNTASDADALWTFCEEYKKVVTPKFLAFFRNHGKSLLQAFRDTHPAISKYLCTNKKHGLMTMFEDSQLAMALIDHFTDREVPILTIHDSFVVPEYEAGNLITKMTSLFFERFGFKPDLKQENISMVQAQRLLKDDPLINNSPLDYFRTSERSEDYYSRREEFISNIA